MNRLALVVCGLALLPLASSQSELAMFVMERLGAVVVEEATNDVGTVFVLFSTGGPRPVEPFEAALRDYMSTFPSGSIALVYLSTEGGAARYVATLGIRTKDGPAVTSVDWAILVRNAHRPELFDFFTQTLNYTFGETQRLSDPARLGRSAPPPPPPTPRTPPPPRNGCVSSTSATGSSMTCYTDGRVIYRSTCTVDSRGNMSCRSNSY